MGLYPILFAIGTSDLDGCAVLVVLVWVDEGDWYSVFLSLEPQETRRRPKMIAVKNFFIFQHLRV